MEGHSLDDLRLFDAVAREGGFTAAGRALGVPKQTVSRRVAILERSLGVRLLHRTTRRTRLTDTGEAFALRCAEIVRLAGEAAHEVASTGVEPTGTLRLSADRLFGETFLPPLLVAFAAAWPGVGIEVVLTRRRVDLAGEGFDLAFRVGSRPDPSLSATALGPAEVRFCASASYVAVHGRPTSAADLGAHECILVDGHDAWPDGGDPTARLVPVRGRLRVESFAIGYELALAGLGIVLAPSFACAGDLRAGRLVEVLPPAPVGNIWLVQPAERTPAARTRAFAALALEMLADAPR